MILTLILCIRNKSRVAIRCSIQLIVIFVSLRRVINKKKILNLVCMTRFRNNLNQVGSKSIAGKTHFFRTFQSLLMTLLLCQVWPSINDSAVNSTEIAFHTNQRPLLANRKKDAIYIFNVDPE